MFFGRSHVNLGSPCALLLLRKKQPRFCHLLWAEHGSVGEALAGLESESFPCSLAFDEAIDDNMGYMNLFLPVLSSNRLGARGRQLQKGMAMHLTHLDHSFEPRFGCGKGGKSLASTSA